MAGRSSQAADDGRVSLRARDAVDGGGGFFGAGPAKITKMEFGDFDFRKKGAPKADMKTALIVSFERGDETEDQPYTVGAGWRVTKDGTGIIPKQGQTGLSKSSNAFPFIDSLEAATKIEFDGPQAYELPIYVTLIQKPIVRDFKEKGGEKKTTILVVDEVIGEKEYNKAVEGLGGGDDEKVEKDEPPSRGRGRDREDEDKKSAKWKEGSAEDIDDQAIEGINTVLEDESPLKIKDLERAIRKLLKGNDDVEEIAARATEDELLELEKGWTYDGKKGVVEKAETRRRR